MLRALIVVLSVFSLRPTLARADAPKAEPAPCKKVFVGKGLDRHAVCKIDQPIVVHENAKPNVIVVHHDDPRKATGRPQSGDRLAGLSHQLK